MRFRQFMDQCIDDDTKKLGGIIKKPVAPGESVIPVDPPVVEPGDIPNMPAAAKVEGPKEPKADDTVEPKEEKKEDDKEDDKEEKKEEPKKPFPPKKEEKDDEEKKEEPKDDEKKAKGGLGVKESFSFISELNQISLN